MHIDYVNSSAIHCDITHDSRYEVVEVSYYQGYEYYIYLLYDCDSCKYNMYIFDKDFSDWPHFPRFVVKLFTPVHLEFACFIFPNFHFNRENYGF